jgi:hypothetical protein
MFVLLLIGVIAAGGAAVHWWAAKDGLLACAVRQKLSETLEGCEPDFESLRFIDASQLELTHLRLRSLRDRAELLHVARLTIEIDPDILRDYRRVLIREIVAQAPEAYLLKDVSGRWNWAGVQLKQPTGSVSPRWRIHNGTVRFGLQASPTSPASMLLCQGIEAQMIPRSQRRYDVQGQGVAETLGAMRVAGLVDGQSGEWRLAGTADEIRLGDPLLDLASRFVPQIQQQLAQLRSRNQALLAQSSARQAPRTADRAGGAVSSSPSTALLRADVALRFAAGQSGAGAPLHYECEGDVQNGHISDLLLPAPLYDLTGGFRLTPESLEIRHLKAANGPSTLLVDGAARKTAAGWGKSFSIQAMQLQLDDRIRGFLWGPLADLFELLSPAGTFNLDIGLEQAPAQPLVGALRKFAAVNCRICCKYFQYPVENISGQITQSGSAFHVSLQGEANGWPAKIAGVVDGRSTHRTIDLHLEVPRLPVDGALQAALAQPEQLPIRKTLESLRVAGMAENVQVDIVRGAESRGKVAICIRGEFKEGTLNYVGFPYEITNLRGRLVYDPLTRDTWLFQDVQGEHGSARLSGRGLFDLEGEAGALALELSAVQAPLDHDLQKACAAASPRLGAIWTDCAIKGVIDLDRITIGWTPGAECQVGLDGIRWTQGEFQPAKFPYAWNNVSGTLQWDGQRLRIHSLHGDHNGTYLLINGAAPDSAFVEIAPDKARAWQFHAEDLNVRKLTIDEEFIKIVPPSVADALRTADIKNTVDLRVGPLDLSGWNADPNLVTASWSVFVTLQDNTLSAGLPLSRVTGNVKVHQARWDGKQLDMEGYGELSSLRALDMPFRNVQGPFLVRENRLAIGTPKLSGNEPAYDPRNPYRQSALKADLYGGQVSLDIDSTMTGGVRGAPYQLELSVFDVELGMWAREHSRSPQKLMGKINGLLQTAGRGDDSLSTTGTGWIQITPAALYELPVFAQIFSILSFRPTQAGDAAFTYAYGDFDVHDGEFDFKKIELVGDAISLIGRGSIGFAGPAASKLDLDFYSFVNNRIPFFGPVIRAFSDRWIYVQVVGSVGQPFARIETRIPLLDQMFGGFMQSMESGQPRRTPPRSVRPPAAAQAPARTQ